MVKTDSSRDRTDRYMRIRWPPKRFWMYSGMVTICGRHGAGAKRPPRPHPACRARSSSQARPSPTLDLEFQVKGSDHILKVLGRGVAAYIDSSGLL